jgi:hypothetical protein
MRVKHHVSTDMHTEELSEQQIRQALKDSGVVEHVKSTLALSKPTPPPVQSPAQRHASVMNRMSVAACCCYLLQMLLSLLLLLLM